MIAKAGAPAATRTAEAPVARRVFPERQLFISVPYAPVAKGRPRVAVRNGHAHGYTPSKTVEAEERIRWHVLRAATEEGWTRSASPLRFTVIAYMPMPASIPKRDRETARPTKRPDCDNVGKLAMDACDVLWLDDAQIVDCRFGKVYARNCDPHWEIMVRELPPLDL